MTLKDLQTAVAKLADTPKTQINAAESNRVLACLIEVAAQTPEAEAVLVRAITRKRNTNAKKA